MGVMCNYSTVVASKLDTVSGLKEGMVKMSQSPCLDLFLTMIHFPVIHCAILKIKN